MTLALVILGWALMIALFLFAIRVHRQLVRTLIDSGSLRLPNWVVREVLFVAEFIYFRSPGLRTRALDKRVVASLVALAALVTAIVGGVAFAMSMST